MENKNYFSLKSFLDANVNRKVNTQDYLHAVFTLEKLPIDLAFSFIKLVCPDFKLLNNFVFLSELFDGARYSSLAREKTIKETQLWLNLVEITGIFEEIDTTTAINVATLICENWNLKLKHDFPSAQGMARVIHDEETQEVFLTID